MALARILVDGYSLLHNRPGIAEGNARHSATARDELITWLARYQDVCGTPVTVIFDGTGRKKSSHDEFARPVEVLFSGAGRTADDLIERVAYRLRAYGEVLAVTDDFAVRDTVIGMGGLAASCDNFVQMMVDALEEQAYDIQSHNRAEKNRFNRPHKR